MACVEAFYDPASSDGGVGAGGLGSAAALADWPHRDAASHARAVVYVVDPDEVVRRRLAKLLSAAGVDVRTFADEQAFIGARRPDAPGCLIVDARLPLASRPEWRSVLSALGLRLPIIVTAHQADVAMAVHAMKDGAVDFLEKPFCDAEMVSAIDVAVQMDRAARLAAARDNELRDRFARLGARERQVMALVTAGKLNKQVAWDLGLSEITVKAHRGSVMRKMEARSLADLVRMADTIGVTHDADPPPGPLTRRNGARGWPQVGAAAGN